MIEYGFESRQEIAVLAASIRVVKRVDKIQLSHPVGRFRFQNEMDDERQEIVGVQLGRDSHFGQQFDCASQAVELFTRQLLPGQTVELEDRIQQFAV